MAATVRIVRVSQLGQCDGAGSRRWGLPVGSCGAGGVNLPAVCSPQAGRPASTDWEWKEAAGDARATALRSRTAPARPAPPAARVWGGVVPSRAPSHGLLRRSTVLACRIRWQEVSLNPCESNL